MQKPTNYILDLPSKKLTIYLILVPAILFLFYFICSIVDHGLSDGSSVFGTGVRIGFGVLAICLVIIVLLWLFWLRSAVHSVDERQLGLPRKWFQFAFGLLWFCIIYTALVSVIEPLLNNQSWGEIYLSLIYFTRETISFPGIMIAYPVVCHYAARAATAKRSGTPATFINSIPFTLLLLFGTVLGIPFLHNYFTSLPASNSKIMVIYLIAFGVCALAFIIGFLAAVTGLI